MWCAMRIDVVTLFPELIQAGTSVSLLGKAVEDGRLQIGCVNPRDFATDKHRTVDDEPFGGGAGMVMKCEPLFAAVESLRGANSLQRVILLSPRGKRFDQAKARELAEAEDIVLVCARYEGVDERVSQGLITEEISIGDYVLSGGELPALVVIEAVSRMLPGVIGDWESVETDSFYHGRLGPPQYTRPAEFRGMEVPAVLREGHHAKIAQWRKKESLRATQARRPDLLENLTQEEHKLLAALANERTAPHEEK